MNSNNKKTIPIILKNKTANFLYKTGVVKKLIEKKATNQYLILMYHRIIDKKNPDIYIEPGMFVLQDSFESHIQFLKKHFDIVTLSAINKLNEIKSKAKDRPKCIITFDDGWHDFFEFAHPVLKKYSIPATVFLPTNYIDSNLIFWTDRLSKIMGILPKHIENKKSYSDHKLLAAILNLSGSFQIRFEKALSILKKNPMHIIRMTINELEQIIRIRETKTHKEFLSWDEVRYLHDSGLIHFGSHTCNHEILTNLNAQEIKSELQESQKILVDKQVVDPSFITFCYPNGNYSDFIIQSVKEAGYSAAVSTAKGWNTFGCDPYKLKRIPIHQDMTSTVPMFACKITELI